VNDVGLLGLDEGLVGRRVRMYLHIPVGELVGTVGRTTQSSTPTMSNGQPLSRTVCPIGSSSSKIRRAAPAPSTMTRPRPTRSSSKSPAGRLREAVDIESPHQPRRPVPPLAPGRSGSSNRSSCESGPCGRWPAWQTRAPERPTTSA
jgi:hypothetical protein